MSREPLARMDVDTRWAYHRKCRALQRSHPQAWPTYWAAYQALLGEVWASADRSVTLAEAWVPVLPCSIEDAAAALIDAGYIDKTQRIPMGAWKEWIEPAIARVGRLQATASAGGRARAAGAARKGGKFTRADAPAPKSGADREGSPDERENVQPTTSHAPAGHQPSAGESTSGHQPHASQPRQPTTPATHTERAPVTDDPDDDVTTLQKLAESLSGTPYGFPRHGGMGEKVAVLVRKHGLAAVEAEWRRIAADERGMPTVRQLVLGADNALNRISAPAPSGPRDEVAEFVAKVKAQTREEAARA